MRFGVWYDFRNPPRWHRPPGDLYAETLAQAAWVEIGRASCRERV